MPANKFSRDEFIKLILEYDPEYINEKYKPYLKRLFKRIAEEHGYDEVETYRMATEILIERGFSKQDALVYFLRLSLDKPIKHDAKKTFLELTADKRIVSPLEALIEIEERRLEKEKIRARETELQKVFLFLKQHLPSTQFNYIENLIKSNRKAFFDIFGNLDKEYVEQNFTKIKGKIDLALNLFPNSYHPQKYFDMAKATEDGIITIYKEVLVGMRKNFPRNTFNYNSEFKGKVLTKYLIEDVLKISLIEIPEKVTKHTFMDNKLRTVFTFVYGGSPFRLVNAVYPEKFRPWEFRGSPLGLWKRDGGLERAIEATKWLVEEKLRIPIDEIPKKINKKDFVRHGLGNMLYLFFRGSPSRAIMYAYPDKFNLYEFKNIKNIWRGKKGLELAKQLIKNLIEEKLKIPVKEIPKRVTTEIFCSNGLETILKSLFHYSVYEAINAVYSNKFRPWEFIKAPQYFWSGRGGLERAIEAVKWLVEEKLQLSTDELHKLKKKDFEENGLAGMLYLLFNNSISKAINAVYPNKFNRYDLIHKKWKGEKGLEHAKGKIRWLIEDELRLPVEEIPKRLMRKHFVEYGLSRMIRSCFNNSFYEAINSAYPNKFKSWEFKHLKMFGVGRKKGKWVGEEGLKLAREAIKWLVEEKEKIPLNEVPYKVNYDLFKKYRLFEILCSESLGFKNSIYKAINNAYPGVFSEEDFKSRKRG